MNQVFYNILGNALKFSDPKRDLVIDITCQEVNESTSPGMELVPSIKYYRIVIRDNGIGFEQQYADQIFAIFERLHNVSQFEGTGIGLALCLRIVQFHNGGINAEGKPGFGSNFALTLPARQVGTNVAQQFTSE